MRSIHLLLAVTLALASLPCLGVEYSCNITRKLDSERDYPADMLAKYQYSVRIEEGPRGTFVSRCSYSSSEKKVTCDRYQMDKVVFDQNVKIKKYYLFSSQFDVQLFPDLSVVENNGRAGLAFGTCRLVSP